MIVDKKRLEIQLISKSEDEYYLEELLKPLVNIDFLLNFIDKHSEDNLELKESILENELYKHKRYVLGMYSKVNYTIEVLSIKKSSPCVIQLLVEASPYVIDMIIILLNSNENLTREYIYSFLMHFKFFKNLDESKKNIQVNNILTSIKAILTFSRISLR